MRASRYPIERSSRDAVGLSSGSEPQRVLADLGATRNETPDANRIEPAATANRSCARTRAEYDVVRLARAGLLVLAFGTTAVACDGSERPEPPVVVSSCQPGRPSPAGAATGTITSSGIARSYLLHVPTSYNGARPVPLVFNFHGYAGDAASQMEYGDLRPLAEREGFVVVAPDGQGEPRHFAVEMELAGDVDDTVFTSDLLAHLRRTLCIDSRRVYATGMSNGGAFSTVLGCRAAGQFAAVASVAAVWDPGCDRALVPVVAFIGERDFVWSFTGGALDCCGGRLEFGPALTTAEAWAAAGGCDGVPVTKRAGPHVRHLRYAGCDGRAAVELYAVEDGGHTWPGTAMRFDSLGHTTDEIDASALMWRFFEAHAG